MRSVSNIETQKRRFDFTSSGQGTPLGTSVSMDGIEVFNHAEAVDDHGEDENVFQAIICESCGFVHCEPGGWIALRRSGSYHVLIPAFDWLREEEVSLKKEYMPPAFMKKIGALVLDESTLQSLRLTVPALSAQTIARDLSGYEAAMLFRFETPQQLFGSLPSFEPLNRDRLLATSRGEVETEVDALLNELRSLEQTTRVALLRRGGGETILSFFLDDMAATEWKAAAIHDDGLRLLLGDFLLIPERNS